MTTPIHRELARRHLLPAEHYVDSGYPSAEVIEQAHRQLMRAHYLRGQRAAAVRQYRACVADLQRELGVPPSLLTQRLADAIAADTALPSEEPAGVSSS